MSAVRKHYETHLGPVYAWMAGGIAPAQGRGAAELDHLQIAPGGSNQLAVDLGAGFGMHAVPLARGGFHVLAIDSCKTLLDDLRKQVNEEDLEMQIIEGDLLDYHNHLSTRPGLALCMGDTLTHLPDKETVERLFNRLAHDLEPGGRFLTTFRDYSKPLTGENRFIPVRSDARRVMTCFLEYVDDAHVMVHDILHEWDGEQWRFTLSAYPKLRLAPDWVVETMRTAGFAVEQSQGPAGMVRLLGQVADSPQQQ